MNDTDIQADGIGQAPHEATDAISDSLDSAGLDDMPAGHVSQDALDAAQQEVLYARAETQNVRRRLEKEIQDARNYATTGFAREILSVADNLSRALEAMPASLRQDETMKPLVTGIEATQRELHAIFERNGIIRIAAIGETLDPNRHQAMLEIPHDEAAAGTIVQEMQPGYMIKDRLLRPALVGVAKKPD